jgi:hypothetical protein
MHGVGGLTLFDPELQHDVQYALDEYKNEVSVLKTCFCKMKK